MSGGIGRLTEEQVRREMIRADRRASRRRTCIGAAVVLVLALVAGGLVGQFLFALTDIRTCGMGGALESGDVVLCERMDSPVRLLALRRGSLALVRYTESGMQRETVRRVIAMAGDEVSVEADGRVTVNGEAIDEPYASYRDPNELTNGEAAPGGALENPFASPDVTPPPVESVPAPEQLDDMDYPLTVPEGELFVLCDDRENALDSRSSRFGLVKEANVLGLARLVIWPAHRVGMLTDG